MYGLFNGLEIGKRALISTQLAMTTIGHNMANVNTPGFSRQRVSIVSGEPVETIWGNAGSGVKITGIEQIRDLFLTGQYRDENSNRGQWESLEKSLSQIEGYFNEPQENSLGDAIDKFWKAWQALANNPESHPARASLSEEANALINSFRQIDKQLTQLRQNVDVELGNRVMDLNKMGAQIANLNYQIHYQELGSEKANDLRDQRDLLVDELSQYADVRVVERANGTVAILIGAMAFVDGSDYLRIGTKSTSANNSTTTRIVWENSDVDIKFNSGEIKALLDTRDLAIPRYQEQLDELASGIVESVNTVHRTGYGIDDTVGNRDFFDPTFLDAAHISLDISIQTNLNNIAAAVAPGQATGDGSNALAIAGMLSQTRVMDGNTATIREFYGGLVGSLGIDVDEATNYKDNYALLVQQIENQRQSVQGVSLDEEMTNMIKFQHAYDAAARVITTYDQALDTLINGMGVVGR